MESIHEFEIEEEPQRESFRILDDAGATWAMRRLHDITQKMDANRAIAESEIQRITAWLETVNNKVQSDADYFINILEDYHRRQRDTEGRKTIKLPHGSLISRASTAKVKVTDPELFVKWAKDVDENLIRIKEEPNQSEINKLLIIDGDKVISQSTGELAEGVIVTPESVKYSVEVEK
jgi:hypothetical protein